MGLIGNERAQLVGIDVACVGDARHLEEGGGRGDVGVEAAGRGGDQIDRDRRPWIVLGELGPVAFDPVDQGLVGRPKI